MVLNNVINIVLIGPLPIKGDVIGGTKVSFSNLVSDFHHRNNFSTEVINSSRPIQGKTGITKRWLNLRGMVQVLLQLWRASKFSNVVMWNVSPRGAMFAAPLIQAICMLRGCHLVVRLFGGDFDEVYKKSSSFSRWIANKFLLKSDIILLQTNKLVEYFKNRARVEFFPTTRDMPVRTRTLPTVCQHLLFIGQLRPEKGITEILEMSRHIPADVEITIAGPLMPGFDLSTFDKYSRVKYIGNLSPEDVPSVIEAHDAFIFPSYYEGEGYPGVVIEALQLELPIVTTYWKALPELIENNKNGLLVPPRDKNALLDATKKLINEKDFFQVLQKGAKERGEEFRAVNVMVNLVSWINKLVVR